MDKEDDQNMDSISEEQEEEETAEI